MKPGHIDPNADLEFFTIDDLREEHDRLSDRLAAVERRIEELEQDAPSDEPTGFRAMYYAIK